MRHIERTQNYSPASDKAIPESNVDKADLPSAIRVHIPGGETAISVDIRNMPGSYGGVQTIEVLGIKRFFTGTHLRKSCRLAWQPSIA